MFGSRRAREFSYFPRAKPDVVRLTVSWIFKSQGMWQHETSAAYAAAQAYFFRPRPWVREIADCIMREGKLYPRKFVNVFLRQSAEKEEELRRNSANTGASASLPSMADYMFITKALAVATNVTAVFVQSASQKAIDSFQAKAAAAGLTVSYTENPRSESDTEGGRFAHLAMWHGVVAAVNLFVGQQAAASHAHTDRTRVA